MRYCILGVMYLFIFILGAGLMPQENPVILLDEPLPQVRFESIHQSSDVFPDHSLVRLIPTRMEALNRIPVTLAGFGDESSGHIPDGIQAAEEETRENFGTVCLTILLPVITVLFILRGKKSGSSSG